MGPGITIPYFFAVSNDKNFTLSNKLYYSENPLFIGEFHQAFQNSSLIADFGYTKGFKKTNSKKQEQITFFLGVYKKFLILAKKQVL